VCAGNHERATDIIRGTDRSDTLSREFVKDALVVNYRAEGFDTVGLSGPVVYAL
jgi:hypothetical protein